MANEIVYRIIESPLGELVVGATEEGCCVCEFEDRGSLSRIIARAERRYRLSMVPGNNPFIDLMAAQVAEYFAGTRRTFTLQLDLRGTPFERSVWNQLLNIPYGETRSYGGIASALGKPGAARAVGRANGANYLAIIVPCHRVIQEDGSLRGYGGGLWRKQYLLDLEKDGSASDRQPHSSLTPSLS